MICQRFFKALHHLILFFFCLLFLSPYVTQAEKRTVLPIEADSLRTERKAGKLFVVHRVEAGETLYSIGRRYGASVDEIKQANGGLTTNISVGQEIRVPWNKRDEATGAVPQATADYHLVEPGQTLYSISRLYNVSVDDLKAWNKLQSNELAAGQRLIVKNGGAEPASAIVAGAPGAGYSYHVVQPSETLYGISRKFDVTIDEIKEWNNLSGNTLSVGQSIIVGKPEQAGTLTASIEETPAREKKKELLATENGSLKQINKKGYTTDTTQVAGYEKVIEEGFAAVIENSPDTNKFLALHRTAPIGAILEVKNRMNDRSIYVRVVGTLPDTGVNNKVLIRLSQKAFERLGSPDPKVPVEVSYVP